MEMTVALVTHERPLVNNDFVAVLSKGGEAWATSPGFSVQGTVSTGWRWWELRHTSSGEMCFVYLFRIHEADC